MTDVGNGSEAAGDEGRPTWPAVGVILAVLWLFVRGVPLTPSAIVGELLVGLVFGLCADEDVDVVSVISCVRDERENAVAECATTPNRRPGKNQRSARPISSPRSPSG